MLYILYNSLSNNGRGEEEAKKIEELFEEPALV